MANYQSRYTGPEIDERLRKAGEAVLTEAQSLDAEKQAQARENIDAASSAAVDGKYTKPSGGIPKADLASGVQASLGKADTAYQKPQAGIPADDLAPGVIPDVSQFITDDDLSAALEAKQDTISDLADIRSGAADNVKYTQQTLTDAQQEQARTNIGATVPEVFWAEYGTTTQAQVQAAVADGKLVACYYNGRVYVYAGESNAGYSQFTSMLYDTAFRVYLKNSSWGNATLDIPTDVVKYAAQSLSDSQRAQARTNIGAGTYSKPDGGIPASDLADGVIPDVSQFITKSVNDLANYYLKSETYTKDEVAALIGAIQQFHYEIYASRQDVVSPANNVLYLIGPTGSGTDKYEEYVYDSTKQDPWVKIGDTSIDLSGYVTTTALDTALAAYTTSADLATLLAGKQDTISDLATIRSGAAAGATAYQKPQGGIPASDLADKYAGSPSAGGPAFKALGIPYGAVDANSTATDIKATVDNFPATLTAGVCAYIRNDVIASASGFTLNINGTGALPVYQTLSDASRATTVFTASSTYLFVYNPTRVEGGCWDIYYGYNANDNTIGYILRTNYMSMPVTSACYRYRLLFTSANGQSFVPANASSSTNATAARTTTQTPIDPFGSIRYYNYTTAVTSGNRPGATYLCEQYQVTLGYSFNRTGAALVLSTWDPVYIKCAPQSDGSAIIDADTPYVQALPSTEDGKIYIFLGVATSATQVEVVFHHPVYYFKDGAIRQWTNAAATSNGVQDVTVGGTSVVTEGVAEIPAIPEEIDTVNVTVDNATGTPSASGSVSGGTLSLAFHNLKGAKGDTGPQGAQGNPGSSQDYPFTLANNLTTDDSTVALTAAQGVVLNKEINGKDNSATLVKAVTSGTSPNGAVQFSLKAGTYKVSSPNFSTLLPSLSLYFRRADNSNITSGTAASLMSNGLTLTEDCVSVYFYGGTAIGTGDLTFVFDDQEKEAGLRGEIAQVRTDLEADIANLEGKIFDGTLDVTFEQGSYYQGAPSGDPKKVRYNRPFSKDEFPVSISIPQECKAKLAFIYYYTDPADYTSFISSEAIAAQFAKGMSVDASMLPTGANGFAVTFQHEDGTTYDLTPEMMTGVVTKRITLQDQINAISPVDGTSYYGKRIDVNITDQENKMQKETVILHTPSTYIYTRYNQSMAIHGGLAFCFNDTSGADSCFCVVIDLATKTVAAKIDTIPPVIIAERGSHLNNANFTDVFYDPLDEFPLLLLSRGDYADGSLKDQEMYIFRVARSGATFTFTHVKTIKHRGTYYFNPSWEYDSQRKMIWGHLCKHGDWRMGPFALAANYLKFDGTGLYFSAFADTEYITIESSEAAAVAANITITVGVSTWAQSKSVSVPSGGSIDPTQFVMPYALSPGGISYIALNQSAAAFSGKYIICACDANGNHRVPICFRAVLRGFPAPDLRDSSEVTVTEADMTREVEIDAGIFQGGCCFGGKLILPFSAFQTLNGQAVNMGDQNCIVADPTTGDIESVFPTGTLENQGCAVYNGKIYISSHYANAPSNYDSFTLIAYTF